MQQSSKDVVIALLAKTKPAKILDVPSGGGWLGAQLPYAAELDGVDLYVREPGGGYKNFLQADLDEGLPKSFGTYDCILSCEGIEHFGNPLLFLRSIHAHLAPGGMVVITTPNVWYPEAKLQFWLRGFYPGFPCLAGKIKPGTHMHITPWSFPHLYLYLKLAGFADVELHAENMSVARHFWEWPLALPQRLYCRSKAKKASDPETKKFWETAGSGPSVFGRHLIVTARRP